MAVEVAHGSALVGGEDDTQGSTVLLVLNGVLLGMNSGASLRFFRGVAKSDKR